MDGYTGLDGVEEGLVYSVKVDAKGARGEGIGKVGNFVVFIKNAKTRIGNMYSVKVTKVYRTYAFAELKESKHQFVGNGSIILNS
jgi:predicted RNA-binding protein with TRAM domain